MQAYLWFAKRVFRSASKFWGLTQFEKLVQLFLSDISATWLGGIGDILLKGGASESFSWGYPPLNRLSPRGTFLAAFNPSAPPLTRWMALAG